MAASSFVDFVFRAKGIVFYGGAASFNKHFMCYLESYDRFYSNSAAWMLLSRHQKLGHKQPSSGPSSHGRITSAMVSYCL